MTSWRSSTAITKVLRGRHDVGLAAAALPASLAIAWSCCTLRFAGEAMSLVAPGWMRRHFQL